MSVCIAIYVFVSICDMYVLIGLLDNIFDGIQRPLERIAQIAQSVFVPKGVDVPALDHKKLWHYVPRPEVQVGDILTGRSSSSSSFRSFFCSSSLFVFLLFPEAEILRVISAERNKHENGAEQDDREVVERCIFYCCDRWSCRLTPLMSLG